ncbi:MULTISPECIES: shikimate dehydrogenase [Alteribacter]|uniref:Shikimate dehydrogenase (NADP(+)) n=1 Tax=Alteribacter keqinensis TaxID=2483800 RepID=A0A3M7TT78_9BACI|nr:MULTISPECIES: shikimate dehydrogenase [Alteribacter]MBM7097141.1 shikimate dehydrogenase [Alteribacter salitolerans]RNA68836.1 shikimate dehydrogenase [Alteribacter keqinensis]
MNLRMGVFGHPIGHSMSPAMHNAALAEVGLQGSYGAYDIHPEDLEEAVRSLREDQFRGVNVTLPHKVNVMPFLDEISSDARTIGAVNTIVQENGRLIGYNTDGQGYLDSLLTESGEELKNKKVLIIGAGGAARAVAVSLLKYGVQVLAITNRTMSKAKEIARICEPVGPVSVLPSTIAQANLTGFDVIINTTSIGMAPDIDRMPFSLETLKRDSIVSDLIYTPLKTRWLQVAENKGAKTINGLGMFINQGAIAFELWTGRKAPREKMKQTVLDALKKQEAPK